MNSQDIIYKLKQGNKRFINNLSLHKNNLYGSIQQKPNPDYMIISCMDCRVPIEYIFDFKIGEAYVIRVAGNTINKSTLDSIEFVISNTNVKLILVLGHYDCAAIKAAIDNEPNIMPNVIKDISPAIKSSNSFEGQKNSTNTQFVDTVCKNNILNSINIISNSTIVKNNSSIKLASAIYSVHNGSVSFIGD